jgi:hypothetical protein
VSLAIGGSGLGQQVKGPKAFWSFPPFFYFFLILAHALFGLFLSILVDFPKLPLRIFFLPVVPLLASFSSVPAHLLSGRDFSFSLLADEHGMGSWTGDGAAAVQGGQGLSKALELEGTSEIKLQIWLGTAKLC